MNAVHRFSYSFICLYLLRLVTDETKNQTSMPLYRRLSIDKLDKFSCVPNRPRLLFFRFLVQECDTDRQPASPEAPYVCPPDLVIPEGVDIPETDKQAQIIERTAVFVARQGNQMEIILKAKQTSNPLFGFLNYDHQLNPFYKEVVKLIRSGRYIPKARPQKIEPNAETKFEPNKAKERKLESGVEKKMEKFSGLRLQRDERENARTPLVATPSHITVSNHRLRSSRGPQPGCNGERCLRTQVVGGGKPRVVNLTRRYEIPNQGTGSHTSR
ncbi:unnamed protein product [Echinostoma caproni]|uniref:SURP motif domain-containing protein n=1 Tax=Echinostoma caproni TaxID=27848 RepID=A0A183AT17_9TREM|nr:unnamed protein product [Echinostoma caproni]